MRPARHGSSGGADPLAPADHDALARRGRSATQPVGGAQAVLGGGAAAGAAREPLQLADAGSPRIVASARVSSRAGARAAAGLPASRGGWSRSAARARGRRRRPRPRRRAAGTAGSPSPHDSGARRAARPARATGRPRESSTRTVPVTAWGVRRIHAATTCEPAESATASSSAAGRGRGHGSHTAACARPASVELARREREGDERGDGHDHGEAEPRLAAPQAPVPVARTRRRPRCGAACTARRRRSPRRRRS